MDTLYAEIDDIQLASFKDIYLIEIESGLSKSPFLPSQEILEEYVTGCDTPIFYGQKKSPLDLTVTFSKLDGIWTYDDRRDFARILDPENSDKYLKFKVLTDPAKIYYVKYIDGVDIYTNGEQKGYITVHFRCDSPYYYSDYFIENKNYSAQDTSTHSISNLGNTLCRPEIEITKVGAGSISIVNTTNAGKTLTITGLQDNEIVYVNGETTEITTSLPDTYRYDNHNGTYLELVYGVNNLQITGKCQITFKYKFKFKG